LRLSDFLRVRGVPYPVPCNGVGFLAPLRALLRLPVGTGGRTDAPLFLPGVPIDSPPNGRSEALEAITP
jgi:hypothetical protein